MDYRNYKNLMKRYHELGEFSPVQNETEDTLIKKLMDISYEKKQIYNEANAIIKEYIVKYEQDAELLDDEAAAMLDDFLNLLMPDSTLGLQDPSILLRISRLLLAYYQTIHDLEQIIRVLRFCSLFDLLLKEHTDDYESSPYSLMAQQYMDDFDKLSDQGKRSLLRCFITCAENRKDPTFALKKYREVRDKFEEIYQKAGDDLGIKYNYFAFMSLALVHAVEACQKVEDAQKSGITLEELPIDIEKDAPLMEEFVRKLEDALASKNAHDIIPDRITTKLRMLQTEYYLGKLTTEELLERIEECSRLREEYDAHERFSALLETKIIYIIRLSAKGTDGVMKPVN